MKGIGIMKAYEIADRDNRRPVGVLLYYEKDKTFIVELKNGLNEWTAPLLFAGLVKRGIYTVPRDISFLWVSERVIPAGRQNIDAILTNHHLKEYDEMKLLELSEGKCSQDNLFIRRTDTLPDYVIKRMRKNLVDFVLLDDADALCFFADETVKKLDLRKIEDVGKMIGNRQLLETAKTGCGGYYVTFNDSIDIPAKILYESGVDIPLSRNDFIAFLQKNVCDTTESCKLLNCSRQNLSYLVKHEQLPVAKEDVNGNLYLKGDVLRSMW